MKQFQIPNHLKDQDLKVMGVNPENAKRSRLEPVKNIKEYLSAKFYITLPHFLQKIFKTFVKNL